MRYSQVQAGVYVQDDWRVLRSLLLSAGVRYGSQNHVGDAWNLSPRVSAAWSPYRDGKLTFRASYGYFYDWIAGDIYKQTLLVDGYRQRELNIINPSYPDPGLIGTSPPTNRYLWSDDLLLPNAHRFSSGVDRVLTPNSRVSATYSFGFGTNLLRPRNLNVPVGGVRPNPEFANELKLVSDADSNQHTVNVGWNLMKMDWRRLFLFVNYTLSTARTNTTGAFSPLAAGDDLDAEWGPTSGDARHRVGGSINVNPLNSLSVSLNASYRTATPYNVTTGRDDNGDGVFNDRPAGTSRNSARGSDSFDLGGRVSWGWSFGPPRSAGGGGGGQTMVVAIGSGGGGGGAMAAGFAGGRRRQAVPRRLLRVGAEHPQSHQLHELQRRADVAAVRPADQRRHAAPRPVGRADSVSSRLAAPGLRLWAESRSRAADVPAAAAGPRAKAGAYRSTSVTATVSSFPARTTVAFTVWPGVKPPSIAENACRFATGLPSIAVMTSPSLISAFCAGEPSTTPPTRTPGPSNAKSGTVPKLTRLAEAAAGAPGCPPKAATADRPLPCPPQQSCSSAARAVPPGRSRPRGRTSPP